MFMMIAHTSLYFPSHNLLIIFFKCKLVSIFIINESVLEFTFMHFFRQNCTHNVKTEYDEEEETQKKIKASFLHYLLLQFIIIRVVSHSASKSVNH